MDSLPLKASYQLTVTWHKFVYVVHVLLSLGFAFNLRSLVQVILSMGRVTGYRILSATKHNDTIIRMFGRIDIW